MLAREGLSLAGGGLDLPGGDLGLAGVVRFVCQCNLRKVPYGIHD